MAIIGSTVYTRSYLSSKCRRELSNSVLNPFQKVTLFHHWQVYHSLPVLQNAVLHKLTFSRDCLTPSCTLRFPTNVRIVIVIVLITSSQHASDMLYECHSSFPLRGHTLLRTIVIARTYFHTINCTFLNSLIICNL